MRPFAQDTAAITHGHPFLYKCNLQLQLSVSFGLVRAGSVCPTEWNNFCGWSLYTSPLRARKRERKRGAISRLPSAIVNTETIMTGPDAPPHRSLLLVDMICCIRLIKIVLTLTLKLMLKLTPPHHTLGATSSLAKLKAPQRVRPTSTLAT